MMKESFLIDDQEILEAVAFHTSGKRGMCDLTKALFIADKIEPGRPQSTDQYRARLFAMSLDDMLYSVLEENYDYIKGKGFEVSLEADEQALLAPWNGKPVILGVRPEYIAEGGDLNIRVSSNENLGMNTLVHGTIADGVRITAKFFDVIIDKVIAGKDIRNDGDAIALLQQPIRNDSNQIAFRGIVFSNRS